MCVCCVEWRQVRPDLTFSRHAFVHLRRFMRLKPSNMSAHAADVNAEQSLACATRAMKMFLTCLCERQWAIGAQEICVNGCTLSLSSIVRWKTYGFRCVCDVLHQLVFGGTQCALYIVTGTRTKHVDSCQKQMVHHDYGETSAKSPVGMVMSPLVYFFVFVRVKAGLDQNAEDICTALFFWRLSCGERDCCAAVRCGDARRCV